MASHTKPTRVKITGHLTPPPSSPTAPCGSATRSLGQPTQVGPDCPPDVAAARFRADLFAGRLRVTVDDVRPIWPATTSRAGARWIGPATATCFSRWRTDARGAGSRDQGGPNDNSG